MAQTRFRKFSKKNSKIAREISLISQYILCPFDDYIVDYIFGAICGGLTFCDLYDAFCEVIHKTEIISFFLCVSAAKIQMY